MVTRCVCAGWGRSCGKLIFTASGPQQSSDLIARWIPLARSFLRRRSITPHPSTQCSFAAVYLQCVSAQLGQTRPLHVFFSYCRTMVHFRVDDASVDPCFQCRICGVTAYTEAGIRVKHPGFLLRPRPLYWLNAKLDEACWDAIEVVYRGTPLAGQTLKCIEDIEKDEKSHGKFLERKNAIWAARCLGERSCSNFPGAAGNVGRTIVSDEGPMMEVTKGAFTFFPEKDYPHGDPCANGLGHTVMKFGGAKGVAIYDLPPGALRVVPKDVG